MVRIATGFQIGISDGVFHTVCLNDGIAGHCDAGAPWLHAKVVADLQATYDAIGKGGLGTIGPKIIGMVVLGVVKAACTQPNSIMECLVCAFDIAEGLQIVLSHDGKCIGIAFIPIPHIFIVVVDTCRKGERL